MRRHDVEFRSAGALLSGTVSLPDGDGPWPGLVTVHPASDGRRDFRLFAHLESLLLPAGFALLRYDRRGAGASGGDFAAADFDLLASDALAAMEQLGRHPGVDAARLGIYGMSQGGWIGPAAAGRSSMVRFLVLVGACAVTPAEQMRYAAATAIRAAGYGEQAVRRGIAVRTAVDEAMRGDRSRQEAASLVRDVAAEPWFEHAFVSEPAPQPGRGDEKWRLEMDYDIGPVLDRVAIPVLLIHGEHDRWTPIEESRSAWLAGFAGRPHLLTAVRVPGTGHFPTLARGAEGEEAAPISPDYEALLLRWLRDTTEPAF